MILNPFIKRCWVLAFSIVTFTSQAQFRLQLLHSSDMEAGLPALQNAPHFAALVDTLEKLYPNTIKLSGGDNYIPSPFLNASTDPVMRLPLQAANAALFRTTTNTNALSENYARVDMTLMNLIGFHASAIGNHEFDLGPNVFADAIRIETSGTELRWSGNQFPYLSCNLDFTSEPSLSALFTEDIRPNTDYITPPATANTTAFNKKIAPATILTVGGEKIGVVGATTQVLESISSVGAVRVKGVKTDNMDALALILQPYINALITQHGCNKIILLSHLQQIALEKQLIGKLNGVDIIVAAGSHTLQADANDVLRAGDTRQDAYPTVTKNKDNDDALIVSTDGEWKYLGRLVVDFSLDGKVLVNSLDPAINGAFATDTAGVARIWGNYSKAFYNGGKGQVARDLCQALNNVIVQQEGNIFGKTNVFLEGRRTFVRTEETNFGSLTSEANLWYAKQQDPTVQVSIKNGGGIRSAIGEVRVVGTTNRVELLPPQANVAAKKLTGDISQLDILNSLRFNNGLTLVSLTPAQLLQALNHAVSGWTATATPGAFPQVSGLRFRFDPARPVGQRVTEAVVVDTAGKILDIVAQRGTVVGNPERLIRVVSLNFLVDQAGTGPNGGDGYPFNAFVLANPARANKIAVTKAGTDPRTGNAQFAVDGSEQDAFAEYLYLKHRTLPYAQKDTSARFDARIQNLYWQPDKFPSTEKKIIFTQGNVKVFNGGFGSDMCLVPGKANEFFMLTDRGPNADSSATATTKIFSNPEFTPQIGRFGLYGDSIILLEKILLKTNNGVNLTGLPNPVGAGNSGERARDINLNLLSNDANGIDPEGLAALADGTFWISDEYGPHLLHVDATGRTLELINPFGTGFGGRKLPQVLALRRPNRGMEGLTITPDGKTLVGIMQSTIFNPGSSGLNGKTTRLLLYNFQTGASKQFVYTQDANGNSNSGITAINDSTFLVLERDGNFQGGTPAAIFKRFYKITLTNATDVSDPADRPNGKLFGNKTLEQLTETELASNGIVPVSKVMVTDLLTDIPSYPHDKLEGAAIINDSLLAVVNDDDFGVVPDLKGAYLQKYLQATNQVDNNVLYFVKLRQKLSTPLITATESGFTNNSSHALQAYPVPSSDVVYFNKTIKNGALYNMLGQWVQNLTQRDDLEVRHLAPGIYILKTEQDESIRIAVK